MQESTETLIETTPEMAPEAAPQPEAVTPNDTSSASEEPTPDTAASEAHATAVASSEAAPEAETATAAESSETAPETEIAAVAETSETAPEAGGETPPVAAAKKPARVLSYQPQDVLGRMRKRPEALEAYQQAVWKLYIHIRTGGLGAALAALLQEPAPKLHRSLYWDISKWVLKEQRIKGKNARSLLESLVYGDTHYLRRATDSVVLYLEEIIRLSETSRFKSNRSKSA